MKLLAVSDLHFGLTQFDWVAQQAEYYDAVVIAGDLLDISGHLDLAAHQEVEPRRRTALGDEHVAGGAGNGRRDLEREQVHEPSRGQVPGRPCLAGNKSATHPHFAGSGFTAITSTSKIRPENGGMLPERMPP